MSKVSDEQFYECLRKAAGLYGKTARLIKKEFQISYTRQAVRDRALKNPEILEEIKENSKDIAEEGIQASMRSKDERVRYKACYDYATMMARERGYVVRQEIVNPDGNRPLEIIVSKKKDAKDVQNFLDSLE